MVVFLKNNESSQWFLGFHEIISLGGGVNWKLLRQGSVRGSFVAKDDLKLLISGFLTPGTGLTGAYERPHVGAVT